MLNILFDYYYACVKLSHLIHCARHLVVVSTQYSPMLYDSRNDGFGERRYKCGNRLSLLKLFHAFFLVKT